MSNETKVLVQIPFHGFYESIHDAAISDAVLDHVAYSMFEENIMEIEQEQANIVNDWIYDNIHKETYDKIKNEYAKKFVEEFGHEYDLDTIEFSDMSSPREYNFETDRIFAKVDLAEMNTLANHVDMKGFVEWVKERLEPRDGFIPYYSNDISDWGLFKDWDHNQFGLLIEYFTKDDDFDMSVEILVNEFESVNNIDVK